MRSGSRGHVMGAMVLRKGNSLDIALALIAILFFMPPSIVAAEEIRQRQVVGDVEVVLTVLHAKELPGVSNEFQGDHHLVIWLFDRATSSPIENAQVKAEVAAAGYAGSEKMLKPLIAEEKPAYGNFFVMPGRGLYRISIKVMRPGMPRAIEARFEYRHHHKLKRTD